MYDYEEQQRILANVKLNEDEADNILRPRTIDEYIGQEITLGVRPEDIHDEEIFISSSPNTVINAHVDVMEKLGNET